ncbi:hypothetical protein CLAFUW4_07022 [Fulvia fulva]|uniref:Uncharacterized protein n=1 Tax=Passalora fulva TaxID=5499 RepID=A0A9Q8PAV1_PASFU|nr:uncharacterized protein CLAFUR5_07158 [Fulvia fulva]KAK4621409.1 hypothetical protein CLAFUR4_07031 [Fulvia fulva]KAK4623308.1 hypothetical protein CLAFUR0_07029 [Fulvia fulva]UJO19098.1 hypothetical protein CLAFUR5_07158 [Fulvia fulva]WPV16171.1 hypothetical protein CLAFUW4_07022 [Fulvia fulva]WPV30787.1 hypothetical protein CLAFUW7_07022 [Fulvia fulva]
MAPNEQESPHRARADSVIELNGLSTSPQPAPPPVTDAGAAAAPPDIEAVPLEAGAGAPQRHYHIPHWVFQPTLLFLLVCLIAALIYASCTYLKKGHETPGGHNRTNATSTTTAGMATLI